MGAVDERKLLVVQVAGLGREFLRERGVESICGHPVRDAASIFPALTCPVQASFRTGLAPSDHGVVGNGVYDRVLRRPFFWEQSSELVSGKRIWDQYRCKGKRVAMLFWQQSMGENVDVLLTPAPIHKHHGGMIQDCYCKPASLYGELSRKLGRGFALRNYWGPMASVKSSQWIAEATAAVLSDSALSPDLCLTYLPALDYDLQRFGPRASRCDKSLSSLMEQLSLLRTTAQKNGYEILIFGDYAIAECASAAFPNRVLADEGLFATRNVRGRKYPDFHASRAIAIADHEIAHIYVRDRADVDHVRAVLGTVDGIDEVLDAGQQEEVGILRSNNGELIAVAAQGRWLAYPWWHDRSEAPDYATHVDIHNKPGYDPCELFLGWPPGSITQDTSRVKGSHGKAGPGREIAWVSSCLAADHSTISDLAIAAIKWLNGGE